LLRRLTARFRGTKKKEPKTEDVESDSTTVSAESSAELTPEPKESGLPLATEGTSEMAHPLPEGTLVASSAELHVDAEATQTLAAKAQIRPQRVREIVAGEDLKRDEEGRIHIKIVFYGPSLSGKTNPLPDSTA